MRHYVRYWVRGFIKLGTEPDFELNEIYIEATKWAVRHMSFAIGDQFAGVQVGKKQRKSCGISIV